MIAEIQCLPTPPGTSKDRYAHVDAAIGEIQSSGLDHEVGPLGTSVQGRPDSVWPLLRRVHEACLASGATGVVTVVKLAEGAEDAGPTMDDLTGKFRS